MTARPGEVTPVPARQVPFTPASVADARGALSRDLRDAGLPGDLVDDAVLVLSEVLSNALRHARPLGSGRIEVRWQVEGPSVTLCVTDGGATGRPTPGRPPPGATGGRGLAIVAELADAWGVDREDDASTVWAVLQRPSGPAGAPARIDLDGSRGRRHTRQ